MKTIVVYNSKTGFTKRYAEWIAEVACAGSIKDVEKSLAQNFNEPKLERVDVFYCPGGLNYEKMSASSRLMMRMFVKMIKAKKNKSATEEEMARVMSSSYDIADRRYTEPILTCLRG